MDVLWHISVLGMDYICPTKYLSLQVASGCEHPGGEVEYPLARDIGDNLKSNFVFTINDFGPPWSPVIPYQGMVEGDLHNSSECHSPEYAFPLG